MKREIRKAVTLRLKHPGNVAKKAKKPFALPHVYHLSWYLFSHSMPCKVLYPGGLTPDIVITLGGLGGLVEFCG